MPKNIADRRADAMQMLLNLPAFRMVIIDDEPGRVLMRIVDRHNGAEHFRLEFSPDEADNVARHFWSASTVARANA